MRSDKSVRPTRVVFGNGFSGAVQAFRLGIVIERLGISECIKNCSFIKSETSARGIRNREIEDFPALAQHLLMRQGESVRRELPSGAARKHVKIIVLIPIYE